MRNETNNDEDIFEKFETEVGIIPLDHHWHRYLDRSLFDNLSRFNTRLPILPSDTDNTICNAICAGELL